MCIARVLAVLAAGAGWVCAGVIQGVVLEHASNLPLARTRLQLEKVEPGGARHVVATASSGPVGQFFFSAVPAGFYTLTATRKAFAATLFRLEPGDMRSSVLEVTAQADIFAEIRMKKLGVITGRVLDGNRVGIPDVKVLAYPAHLPLRIAGQGTSDDRGAFRIFGLAPGRYYLRTAAQQLDDGMGVLPTFHPHGTEVKEAAVVSAAMDRETADVDLQPVEGALFKLSATATACKDGDTVAFVLASDTGRKQGSSGCRVARADFEFTQLAPGEYELLAYSQSSPSAGHQRVFYASHDGTVAVVLRTLPQIQFQFKPERPGMSIVGRRRDLAGAGEPVTIDNRASVLPGLWELTATPPSPAYLLSIGDLWRAPAWRGTGVVSEWFPVDAESYEYVTVETSDQGATVSGTVKFRGEATASAPVHLFPMNVETMRRMAGPRLAFSDGQGRYAFHGVAPGRYLIGSAFDVFDVTEDALVERQAGDITVTEGQSVTRDLSLPDR